MVMVHRGWKTIEVNQIKCQSDHGSSISEETSQTTTSTSKSKNNVARRTYESKRPRATAQKFEFVNGTPSNPFRNRDSQIRKLVRGHVVKNTLMKRKHLQNHQGRLPTFKNTPSLKPTHISHAPLLEQKSDNQCSSQPNLEQLMIRQGPTKELDPHPELSSIIYHVSSMGTAMWPLEDLLKFNLVSPVGWFEWALRDAALFSALLYTTSSYAALLRGVTESREGVAHVGKSLGLLNGRLLRMGEGGYYFVEVVEDSTVAAVSCLALTEVGSGIFFASLGSTRILIMC